MELVSKDGKVHVVQYDGKIYNIGNNPAVVPDAAGEFLLREFSKIIALNSEPEKQKTEKGEFFNNSELVL